MEITLGHGNYEVVGIKRDGKEGVLIREQKVTNKVNERLSERLNPFYTEKERDIVIYFENIEGLRVLQNQINIAVLRMDGFTVTNNKF